MTLDVDVQLFEDGSMSEFCEFDMPLNGIEGCKLFVDWVIGAKGEKPARTFATQTDLSDMHLAVNESPPPQIPSLKYFNSNIN